MLSAVVRLCVCLSVLSVCKVCVGLLWPNGWMDHVKLGRRLGLEPDHIVLDEDPAPPPAKEHSQQFWARICCGQMAGWIKMQLGM